MIKGPGQGTLQVKLLGLCVPGVANRIRTTHPLSSPQPYLYPQSCSQRVQERSPKRGTAVAHSSKTAKIRLTAEDCTVSDNDSCFQQVRHQFGETVRTTGIYESKEVNCHHTSTLKMAALHQFSHTGSSIQGQTTASHLRKRLNAHTYILSLQRNEFSLH